MNTRQVGYDAEELACNYLLKRGFKILKRNFTIRGGEIDIVAMDGAVLVFVEVKARYSHEYGLPQESITPWKIRALKKTALFYVLQSKWGDRSYRIDLVAVDYTSEKVVPEIELIENITF